MSDAHQFGAEVAATAIRQLKEIGLAVEEAALKQSRLERVKRSVNRSISLGRDAQLLNGCTVAEADEWYRLAHAAFSSAMEAARRAIGDLRPDGEPQRDS